MQLILFGLLAELVVHARNRSSVADSGQRGIGN
jgi:hypothetical protein